MASLQWRGRFQCGTAGHLPPFPEWNAPRCACTNNSSDILKLLPPRVLGCVSAPASSVTRRRRWRKNPTSVSEIPTYSNRHNLRRRLPSASFLLSSDRQMQPTALPLPPTSSILMTAGTELALGRSGLIGTGFLQVQNSFRQEPIPRCYISNDNLIEVEGGEQWQLTLWSSGGRQQSLAVPWGGAPPHLQQKGRGGKKEGTSWLIQVGFLFLLTSYQATWARVTSWHFKLERLLVVSPTIENNNIRSIGANLSGFINKCRYYLHWNLVKIYVCTVHSYTVYIYTDTHTYMYT